MIAHPFQLVGHAIEGEQVAQVTGNGRLGGDGARDLDEDRGLHLVDADVFGDDRARAIAIPGYECLRGLIERGHDHAAHAQDVIADRAHLSIERLPRGMQAGGRADRVHQPKRPEM